MKFLHPGILWALFVLVPLVAWYVRKQRSANASLGLSTLAPFAQLPGSWKVWLIHACFGLRCAAIACIIIALARPQDHGSYDTSTVEGTDIALAIDISSSMASQDFNPNRFEAAKSVAGEFINGREHDNIALVAFSGETLSLMPLTNDRAALLNALANVQMGIMEDGTAIGDGIASAINRLDSGKAKSKSIILLTDGSYNAGDVHPSTAAEIAKKKGIRIYTIGVGTDGSMTIADPYGFSSTVIQTKIDEQSLKEIASISGGRYFRATNKNMLQDVFSEIEKLEKSRIEVERYSTVTERFMLWVWLAFAALCAELLLRYTLLRRIP